MQCGCLLAAADLAAPLRRWHAVLTRCINTCMHERRSQPWTAAVRIDGCGESNQMLASAKSLFAGRSGCSNQKWNDQLARCGARCGVLYRSC